MRIFAFVAVLFLVSNAALSGAQEMPSARYEENRLETLHYRPENKQYWGSWNATTRLNDSETASIGGASTTNYSRTSWATTVSLEYGLSDLLEIGVSENYLFGLGTQQTSVATGIVTSNSANGFSDPTLKVNYRYWGGLTGAHFGSAYVNFIPAFGQHQNATTTTTGNNFSTSSSLSLGTNLYWVSGLNEYALEPAIRYATSGTNNDAKNPANSSSADANWNASVTGAYRYHLPSDFYLGASVSIYSPYSVQSNNMVYQWTTTYDGYASVAGSAGWKPNDRSLLAVQYSYVGSTFSRQPLSATNPATVDYSETQNYLSVTGHMIF